MISQIQSIFKSKRLKNILELYILAYKNWIERQLTLLVNFL